LRRLGDTVAVVTGASRGAGRGSARVLGEERATVHVTGRTTRDGPNPTGRPGTIDEVPAEHHGELVVMALLVYAGDLEAGDTVDRQVAEAVVDHLRASTAPLAVAQLRVLGGAMARVPVEATAFAHRHSRIMVNLAAFYGPDDRAEREAWVDEFAAALRQDDQGAYVNFLGEDGGAGVRAAYPGSTWERLAAVKARYDPTNLFRRNHNIPPAEGPSR
jgi:NAD(P)-dependent dehydrogenase (short-subunit alcohol dehydrogenase family)